MVEKVNTLQDISLYYSLERAHQWSLHVVWVEQRDGHCIFFSYQMRLMRCREILGPGKGRVSPWNF